MPKASFLADMPEPKPAVSVPTHRSGLFALPVDSIELDPVCQVRTTRHTIEYLHEFAEKLKEEGQSTPVLVRPPARDGVAAFGTKYRLIAGEARLAACGINGTMVFVHVRDVDDQTARRLAFSENFRRRQFTPVDLAVLFSESRDRLGSPANWSARVAEEFGVSRATVTEHVKMYEALRDEPDILDRVKSGELKMDAAIELANTSREDRARVLQAAQEAAGQAGGSDNPPPVAQIAPAGSQPPARAGLDGTKQKKNTVKAKDIREAKRRVGVESRRALTREELVDSLLALSDPSYPPVMNAFLHFVCEPWQRGKGKDAELKQHWRSIAVCMEDGGPGCRGKKPKPAAKVKKPTVRGKTKPKSKK